LKSRREAAGLSQKEVGRRFGWSGVRISYLENGQQNVADDDLDKLLPLYAVPADDTARFYEAAKLAREKGWWEQYDGRVLPDYVTWYVGLEQGAATIRTVEPYIVPGLLQTRDYCVAVAEADGKMRTAGQIARTAEVRLARQQILTWAEDPATLRAVIDESVLRRVVGGPKLMAAQLEHLVRMAQRPNIDIRVFPFTRGVHGGMVGGYRILEFADLPAIAYIERWEGATYLEDAVVVDEQMVAFLHIADAALPPEESAARMQEIAAEYSTT
jgi:transcriptional regulator with XRE-family HTH domain